MQSGIQIGKVGRNPCLVSNYAINHHISETGTSGSGKTVRLNYMELEAVKDGNTVVVLDINESHADKMIFSTIKEEYCSYINRINVKADGLDIRFLQPMKGDDGQKEDSISVISSVAYALGIPQRMGNRQIGVLREAEVFALNHMSEFSTEMEAIEQGILQQNNAVANAVCQKMWPVIHHNIFRKSDKNIKKGKLNVISFNGIDRITQATLIEILLSYLWRSIQVSSNSGKVIFSIDEYQNLMLGEGSVLRNILREGRKFNISLLLATQTMSVFPKDTRSILNQAATRLYFRPEVNEIRNVAKEIDSENVKKWVSILKSLQVGEAVAVGDFCVYGREIRHPILIQQ